MTTSSVSAVGKVALVTGGARGIGAAIAQGLRAIGAKVAVLDLDDAALATCPDDVLTVQADITRAEDCARAASYSTESAAVGVAPVVSSSTTMTVRSCEIAGRTAATLSL